MRNKVCGMIALLTVFVLSLCACDLPKSVATFADREEPTAALLFVSEDDNIEIGTLYYQSLEAEKEKIADNVLRDEYLILPTSQAVLFMDADYALYYKEKDREKEKVSDRAVPSSFTYSGDESTFAFIRTVDDAEDSQTELYIKKPGSEKEKIASDMYHYADCASYQMTPDASKVFYSNAENTLYCKDANGDREKIASDVDRFSINSDGDAYSYLTKQNNYYVNWKGGTEPQKVASDDVGNLRIADNGYIAAFTNAYNYEKGFGELYVTVPGGDAIKIASDVQNFQLSADGTNLYYINEEDTLYAKEIPAVTAKTAQNASGFTTNLNKTEKVKLGSDVARFAVGPEGKNILFLDNDDNLYLSYQQQEKVRISSDVAQMDMFGDSLIYKTKSNQLYRLSKSAFSGASNTTVTVGEPLASHVEEFATSPYGKYIVFSDTEKDLIFVSVDGQMPQTLISDASNYDRIIYKGNNVYEKKLRLSDINGSYKNKELGVAYTIGADSNFTLYEIGEEKEKSPLTLYSIDKLTASLYSSKEDSVLSQSAYKIKKSADSTVTLSINGTEYTLELLDEAGLEKELARQKKAEEDRIAAEQRRIAEEKRKAEIEEKKQKLRERGQNYLRNGVFVSSTQTLYYSAGYSSPSDIHYTTSGNKSVYDYEISSDGSTLWLKLYTTSSSYDGYTGYVWVTE